MTTKVTNTVNHITPQGGEITVAKGRIILINNPNVFPENGALGIDQNNILSVCKRGPALLKALISFDLVQPVVICEDDRSKDMRKGDMFIFTPSDGERELYTFTGDISYGIHVTDYRGQNYVLPLSKTCRVIVKPHQFSPEQLQAIVEGKIKEMCEVMVEVSAIGQEQTIKLNKEGYCIMHKVEDNLYSQKDLDRLFEELSAYLESEYRNIQLPSTAISKWWSEQKAKN